MTETEARELAAQAAGWSDYYEAFNNVVSPSAMDSINAHAKTLQAGERLAGYAGHEDDCGSGVWTDPVPCICGYTEAWKAWMEARGDDPR